MNKSPLAAAFAWAARPREKHGNTTSSNQLAQNTQPRHRFERRDISDAVRDLIADKTVIEFRGRPTKIQLAS
jgi:hypothetical protein